MNEKNRKRLEEIKSKGTINRMDENGNYHVYDFDVESPLELGDLIHIIFDEMREMKGRIEFLERRHEEYKEKYDGFLEALNNIQARQRANVEIMIDAQKNIEKARDQIEKLSEGVEYQRMIGEARFMQRMAIALGIDLDEPGERLEQ